MQIEIAKLGRMSQTGSSLITLYQDKHTPLLDLLIREAVQNCLDAGNNLSEHAENKDYVEVNFSTGDFCPHDLNVLLSGSTEALDKRFPESKARFLAIGDKYTAGLTGPLRMADVNDYKYGNLLKLVYDICKPQEGAGAGGSWGIGKTIFFRVGIGLVVYYSRIWNEETNKFESRFAVSLVEDEKASDTIIPRTSGISNSGIAWWGDYVSDNETEAITNEEEIIQYLSIFGLAPLLGNETGTIVIVPYINEDFLLTNNRYQADEESDVTRIIPTWIHNIEEYISIAVQRWYFPRLNNKKYKYGRSLKLCINGKVVSKSSMLPLFRIWQNIYNCAAYGNTIVIDESCTSEIGLEKIILKKYLDDTCAGYVAYATLGRDDLGMCPPDNLYSPYNYTDLEESEGDSNRPLIAFCRMPGMVVNYRGNGTWLKSVPLADKDKYIIAMFVLNSDNMLADHSRTLEEYVRKSELADHHAWEDYNIDEGKRPDIISKIKANTANKLSKAFSPEDDSSEEKINSGWGQIVAELMLPKEGFGTKSSRRAVAKPRLEYTSHKTISIALSEEDTGYYGDNMEFTYYVKSRIPNQGFNLNIYIDSEAKAINPNEWEEDGLEFPFMLESILFRIDTLDGKTTTRAYKIENTDPIIFDNILTLSFNKTQKGVPYGLSVKFSDQRSFTCASTFTVKVLSRKVRPLVKSE